MSPRTMDRVLLHVMTTQEDAQRHPAAPWVPPRFSDDGFVHLCTPEQLCGVRGRHFNEQDVVVLVLRETLLGAPVKDEDLYGHGSFPHVYGPLPPSAVRARVMVKASVSDGELRTLMTEYL